MVNILLTGTPGTGKSVVAKIFSKLSGFNFVSINDVVGEDYLYMDGGSKVVDPKVLTKKIKGMINGDTVIEGHLAHLLNIRGIVVVLRTNPRELKERLEAKGFSNEKLDENLEAEALDICLLESIENHKRVNELDTTGKRADDVAKVILKIVKGEDLNSKPGKVNWLEDYIESRESARDR
jgi:adenylate kinase